jgi:hypothetical protein
MHEFSVARLVVAAVLVGCIVLEATFLFNARRDEAQLLAAALLTFTCAWAVVATEAAHLLSPDGLWASIVARLIVADLHTFDKNQLASCVSLAVSFLSLFAVRPVPHRDRSP